MKAAIAALMGVLLACSLGACANPSYIGVQDYGYIVGNVLDQNGKPIPNALVTSTGTNQTARSGVDGGFNLQNVATGEQTINVQAAGYEPLATPVTVIVVQNQGVQAGNIVLQSATPAT
jgi:hypothetical protein